MSMTELFICDRAETSEPLPESALALLPPWRRERTERLRREEARQESLWAGLLYAYALRRRGVDPMAAVELLPAGKPVLAGRDDLFFSLSHSGRYVLCAVGEKAVGADVQISRPWRGSMERWFHPEERAWLATIPEEERQRAFYRLWTRKEAWVKAVSGERMLSLSETDVLRPIPGLCFRDYTLPGGYAAAMCSADDPPEAPVCVLCAELLHSLWITSLPGRDVICHSLSANNNKEEKE